MHNNITFSFYQSCNYIFKKQELRVLILVLLGVILSTILDVFSFGIIVPIFQVIFFDKLPDLNFIKLHNIHLDLNLKIKILIIFTLVFVLKNLLIIYINYFSIMSFKKISVRISSELFNLFLKQDYILYLKNSSDNYLQKITDDVYNLNVFLHGLLNLITESIFVAGIAILLFFTNVKIFIFCSIVFFSVIFFYVFLLKAKLTVWSYANRNAKGKLQLLILEGFRGFKDIIIYNLSSDFVKNYNNQLSISDSTSAKLTFLNTVQKYWLEIIGVFAMILALIYFIFSKTDVTKLVPVFGLLIVVFFRLLSSFSRIILHGQNIKFHYPAFSSVANNFKELSNNIRIKLDHNIPFENNIELRNISFFYSDRERSVLNNINLKIKKGESIGIFGKNGSGKSTFLNLISGLLEPTEGSIIIDDRYDLFANRNSWIKNLSYVQQNIFLINSTIRHNIVLADEKNIDTSKFNKILDLLQLNLFFEELPDKIETIVGNDGMNLSGGQKQIISLARALYKNSNILIFDEPTAALDKIKIQLFKEVLLFLKRKKTIFMVTHSKSDFINCFDKILEFESAKIKLI
jgi:ABC-type multidrug transport system fused ATPase/permease subunit